ncbi:hypothetical protein FQZ97_592580 [compost metagenome]
MIQIRSAAALCLAALLTACAAPSPSSASASATSVATWAKEATGGLLTADKGSVTDPGCANQKVDYEVKPLALDAAGQTPALVITRSGSSCLGRTGALSELWVKSEGRWVLQFSASEGEIRALPSRTLGRADVSVSGGSCSSVWRWQGSRYDTTSRCP